MVNVAPYGSWSSPITTDRLVENVVGLSYPVVSDSGVYWAERRPSEGGRVCIVRRTAGGKCTDVFGPDYAARTLAHEYGGRPFTVHGDTVYFSNFIDQRLYRVVGDLEPEPITADSPVPRSFRYAAPVVTRVGHHIYCVRERHADPDLPKDVVNDLVVLASDGEAEPRVVAEGHDFFSAPALSPDGRHIAWLAWDHPRMPWDGTELWEAELGSDGLPINPRLVAGGAAESVTQPRYSPDGRLHFISDRTDWWNLYVDDERGGAPLYPAEAEFAFPEWQFGPSTYDFLADGTIAAVWQASGLGHLGVLRPAEQGQAALSCEEVETDYSLFGYIVSKGDSVVATAGSSSLPASVIEIAIPPRSPSASATPPDARTGAKAVEVTALRTSRSDIVDASYLSQPEPIEFPTENGLTAYALLYRPKNPEFEAPPGELPPLVVTIHGGPTAAADAVLDYGIQYWTSRGFAVVDVNYGGSSGYGRKYRDRLRGAWGIVDLDDCVNCAKYLASEGIVDGDRLLITGGSAGGYTTLCAVTFRNVFAAGASLFGVADAGALARETHKFESRYLDGLIGPWPEARALYEERSPIFHVDQLRTPLILLQGLEDKVVPPEQSQMMADALREKGVPVTYVTFEGEQHGFRKAENIKRATEATLYFFGRVLGFTPAGDIEPVEIDNEAALRPPS